MEPISAKLQKDIQDSDVFINELGESINLKEYDEAMRQFNDDYADMVLK